MTVQIGNWDSDADDENGEFKVTVEKINIYPKYTGIPAYDMAILEIPDLSKVSKYMKLTERIMIFRSNPIVVLIAMILHVSQLSMLRTVEIAGLLDMAQSIAAQITALQNIKKLEFIS